MLQPPGVSVVVCWATVLVPGLLVVVGFTEWLPVALIPEQLLVTTVRYDMVNHSGLGISPLFHALRTQWVFPKVRFTRPLPLAGIATAGCGSRVFRV